MSISPICCELFSVPKSTSTLESNEDRAKFKQDCSRAAVADGATWGISSKAWAEALTDGWVEAKTPARQTTVAAWLNFQRLAFQAELEGVGDQWWSEASAERGALSTFLGIEFGASDRRVPFRLAAVGDSCAVQLSRTRRRSFPLADPSAFSARPNLVGTSDAIDAGEISTSWGSLGAREVLVLSTDAIAKFLMEIPDPVEAWEWVLSLDSGSFPNQIEDLRSVGSLDDDDSTLLRITVRDWGSSG